MYNLYMYIPFDLQTTLQGLYSPKKPLNILDAGAYDGDTANLFFSIFPNATIYAFEPHEDTFQKLSLFRDSHPLKDNLFIYNLGLSSCEGSSDLNSFSANGYRSSSLKNINSDSFSILNKFHPKEDFLNSTILPVTLTTLDKFFEEHNLAIDVLKIDCQGSELDILLGGRNALAQSLIDVIVIEIIFDDVYQLPPQYFSRILAELESNDFYLYDISHIYKQFKLGRTLWAEFVFCRRARFGGF